MQKKRGRKEKNKTKQNHNPKLKTQDLKVAGLPTTKNPNNFPQKI